MTPAIEFPQLEKETGESEEKVDPGVPWAQTQDNPFLIEVIAREHSYTPLLR